MDSAAAGEKNVQVALKLLEAPFCGREPPREILKDSVVFGWIRDRCCETLHSFDGLMTLGEGGRGASPS